MSKHILALLPIGTHSPNIELTICFINEKIQQGYNLTILTCSGDGDACLYNPLGLPSTCRRCKKRTQDALSHIKGDFTLKFTQKQNEFAFDYQSIEDLKSLKHLNCHVGYSALSTYATLTRSADINFQNAKTRKIINLYLQTASRLAESTFNIINNYNIDEFVLFNSRLNTYRSFFDLAIETGKATSVLEFVASQKKAIIFKNAMPHSIEYNSLLIQELYKNIGHLETITRGHDFFERRLNSQFSNEESYTKHQDTNTLPIEFNANNKNISIFNSSEDEFMAIGGSWEDNRLFKTQYEGLKFISEYAKDHSTVFFLRIHPNLNNTQASYLEKLSSLSHDKFIVIPADSPISTYTLMLKSDAVITFGSSIGIEATYWDKPSILLGNCFYRHLGVTHTPNSIEKLTKLLDITPAPINNKLGCLKMASHMINPDVNVCGYSFDGKNAFVDGKLLKRKKHLFQKIESKYTKWYTRELR
ncbi:hypothetical protein VST7929_02621 [Vibrio stylophorae]|uniref:Capsule biosynthesis protein n=1 Tax=Vibrio stylophorae TaxID=659351 RepID=A0ABN8DXF9_9VIBR|nr:hypothetical protein [Vibrio stylophorae]CAH0534671.1 hypothetical protein VST7929_02621 [Vibrio stylophorae]